MSIAAVQNIAEMDRLAESFANTISSRLEEPVRAHLKNVYGCLVMSTVTVAAGVGTHMSTGLVFVGLPAFLTILGFAITLWSTRHNVKNHKMRVGFLLGFSFFSGLALGPPVHLAVMINPQIVVTALVGTIVVFTCFSIAALTAKRGHWLYLGGSLMTLLSSLFLLSLANLFLGSTLIFNLELYAGLFMACGFILYDTQLIIERCRNGDKDFVAHSFILFIDFIDIFRRLLIILIQKEIRKLRKKMPEGWSKRLHDC